MGDSHEQTGIVVGRIRKPHAVRGEVSVEVMSDVPARFSVGSELMLRPVGGSPRRVEIVSSRPKGDLQLVRFVGYETRDDVEPLRGATLEVGESDVPRAPEGSFYHFELIGCVAVDRQAGELGEVIGVIEDGGGWLLEIRRHDQRLLVPFVAAYLERVDLPGRKIGLDLPSGLIDLCTSTS